MSVSYLSCSSFRAYLLRLVLLVLAAWETIFVSRVPPED